jgi:hypothetical protein
MANEKTIVVEVIGYDQIGNLMSALKETMECGTSVIFSFPSSGRVMVLFARSQRRDRDTETSRTSETGIVESARMSCMELRTPERHRKV